MIVKNFFPSINILFWETFDLGMEKHQVREKDEEYWLKLADMEYEVSTILSQSTTLKTIWQSNRGLWS